MNRDRHLYLSGPMGAGKSTVGTRVAAHLGRPFVDLDQALERAAGASIAVLFATRGEAAFRALEAELVRTIAAGPESVIALGGGTVERDATRAFLLEHGVVITLHASLDVLTQRVTEQGPASRPLLGAAPREALEALLPRRAHAYAECDGVVDTTGREVADVVRDVVQRFADRRDAQLVPLGLATYPVCIGEGVATRLCRELSQMMPKVTKVLVVTDAHVAARAREWTQALTMPATHCVLTPGESQKTLEAVTRIWDAALEAHCDRDACILAIGGGVVGDLAGFAAATLLRGVRLIQMPTTLLAMVDSSTGGKTGFDRPQGKNLVGAFWQPRCVLADTDALTTLPLRELRAGLAEVVKTAWIEGESDVAQLERDAPHLLHVHGTSTRAFSSAIARSVRTKARIVARDPHEVGERRLLNLGHTFGHALESASSYTLLHGEAVALGLILAARCTRWLGLCDTDAHEVRLTRLLQQLDIPCAMPKIDADAACAFLRHDKKNAGDSLRFVQCAGPGACTVERVARARLALFLREALDEGLVS